MAVYEILIEGEPELRQRAQKIRQADDELREIADDMWETMESAEGVGLAGPQVAIMRRIITVHVPAGMDDEDSPEYRYVLLNPEIVRGYGEQTGLEGCLSIPGWAGEVARYDSVTVKALGLDNKPVRIKARGYLSRVFQHEIDHLDGVLFTDRMAEHAKLYRVDEDDIDEDAAMLSNAGATREELR
ncbi:MAG: peptide deformylase [Chloroflexota bacterium]|nr:peptide deformylase [Chloroflexota bacterium]